MKLIVFLGNAGDDYTKNRHNLGFMIGNDYAKAHDLKWKLESKFGAEIARTNGGDILVKPQLFYNRTGDVVQKIAHFYKVPADNILVVCDDLDLDFGKIRSRKQGSDGGNNGLKSMIAVFGEGFARIRIGIDSPLRKKMDDADFVLSNFNRGESTHLRQIFDEVSENINEFIESD